MTVFKVNIPENQIDSFKEFLNKIGGEYQLDNFTLSDNQKTILDEMDNLPLSDYTDVNSFLVELKSENGI
jgi:hypothetical protein